MAGVAALLLAVSVSIGWPDAGAWFVGLCIALDLIFHGLSWSALAWTERNPFAAPPAADRHVHGHVFDEGNPFAERNTRWAVLLTAVTMVAESLSLVWRSASCTGSPCL